MKTRLTRSLLAVAVAGMFAAPVAQATNGYFAHGYSTKEKGLAGAGVAYSQDAMAPATNPAGIMAVGERMDIGVALFSPSRTYTSTGGPSGGAAFSVGPQSIESENEQFLIPHFARTWSLDANSAIGISLYGNGGMDTEYKGGTAGVPGFGTLPGTFGSGDAGVNLEQLFINGTYARKLSEKNSVGASMILAVQRFKAFGVGNFAGFSLDPSKLSNNGKDTSTGFGIKLGWQGEMSDKVKVGVSYQSKMLMSEFDDYAGLFAEQGDFDIPATVSAGIAADVGENGKLVLDLQKIYYSDVASIANPFSQLFTACTPGPTNGTGAGCLGGDQGGGFGWKNMTIIKIGYEWMMGESTYRVGFSHGNQPIPESEVVFNILAPAVIDDHLTFGMTMPMGSDSELNLAAMYALNNSISGPNPLDPAQTIELEMDQFEIQVGWAWKY